MDYRRNIIRDSTKSFAFENRTSGSQSETRMCVLALCLCIPNTIIHQRTRMHVRMRMPHHWTTGNDLAQPGQARNNLFIYCNPMQCAQCCFHARVVCTQRRACAPACVQTYVRRVRVILDIFVPIEPAIAGARPLCTDD